jgi:hypothetical protein
MTLCRDCCALELRSLCVEVRVLGRAFARTEVSFADCASSIYTAAGASPPECPAECSPQATLIENTPIQAKTAAPTPVNGTARSLWRDAGDLDDSGPALSSSAIIVGRGPSVWRMARSRRAHNGSGLHADEVIGYGDAEGRLRAIAERSARLGSKLRVTICRATATNDMYASQWITRITHGIAGGRQGHCPPTPCRHNNGLGAIARDQAGRCRTAPGPMIAPASRTAC